ncbi:hypothetical protein H1C71_016875, partial [Ictidomys tridecemlineatus]
GSRKHLWCLKFLKHHWPSASSLPPSALPTPLPAPYSMFQVGSFLLSSMAQQIKVSVMLSTFITLNKSSSNITHTPQPAAKNNNKNIQKHPKMKQEGPHQKLSRCQHYALGFEPPELEDLTSFPREQPMVLYSLPGDSETHMQRKLPLSEITKGHYCINFKTSLLSRWKRIYCPSLFCHGFHS